MSPPSLRVDMTATSACGVALHQMPAGRYRYARRRRSEASGAAWTLILSGMFFKVAPSIPRRGRKQSVIPRQAIVLAVFRIVPKVDIKFLSEFRGQTLQMTEASGCSGCRPFDHVPVIT